MRERFGLDETHGVHHRRCIGPFESIVAFTAKNGAREEKNARDPNILARAVYGAVTSRRPRPRYLVNGSMQLKIMELLPRRAVDRLVKLAVR